MNEAFNFSSRHSEFVKLKAEALIVTAPTDDDFEDDYRRYKVVLIYPNKVSSYSMLQVWDDKKDNYTSVNQATDTLIGGS